MPKLRSGEHKTARKFNILPEDVNFLDEIARTNGFSSRSMALRHVLRIFKIVGIHNIPKREDELRIFLERLAKIIG